MDIKSWSNLIFRYYFERESIERIILHISMQDLIDFAKEENVEIYKDRFASSLTDKEIFRDFVHKFWIGPGGNKDIKDLETKINQIASLAKREACYTLFLPILSVLIMPICENDELKLHGNNYYGHLFPFLLSNHFIDKIGPSNFLANIKLDEIWSLIDQWAINNGLHFQSGGLLSEKGTKQYVRSLMRESLLSPSKIQKFCFLFNQAGLVPKVTIEDDRLLSAFHNYYTSIGISTAKYKQLVDRDFVDYLLSVLRIEYDNWDGTTRIKERDRRTGTTHIEGGDTAYPLLLQMDYDVNSHICSFSFQLYCSDINDIEYLSFIADASRRVFPEVFIKNDGYANRLFHLDESELKAVFQSRHGVYAIHEETNKSLKARHLVTDYYILRLYQNQYVATNVFVKGELYFVVIRQDVIEDFICWLNDNEATMITNSALGGTYSVFRIDSAKSELPSKNNLRFKSEIRCKSVNNLEVRGDDDTDTVYLSDLLPAQFDISGIDVSKDRVFAVSITDNPRYSSELYYDHRKSLWILKVFTNLFQRQTGFQLFCNEAPIPYGRTYKFKKFSLPKHFKELPLDRWGGLMEPPIMTGLRLPVDIAEKPLINWETLKLQMGMAPRHVPIEIGEYQETDYLLYAITSASFETHRNIITVQWIKEIIERISSLNEKETSYSVLSKYSLNNELADYFRMGYINYSYTDEGLCLTANCPTLILLAPKFTRTAKPGLLGKSIVSFSCVDNHFKCLLTGGRTIELIRKIERYQQPLGFRVEYLDKSDYLQPQTIYIHAANRSIFKNLAEKCGLLYQDNVYANALLESLPTAYDYMAFKEATGTTRDFSGIQSYRVIDYSKMAVLYQERQSKRQCVNNSEIDKEHYDPDSDVVTFFPGSRDETTVMITNGRMIEIDKYWGHFVGMIKGKSKVLKYDEDLSQIRMPQQLRLPLLYARALTLLTGTTPNSSFGSRAYNISVNPLTAASRPENILDKLGQ